MKLKWNLVLPGLLIALLTAARWPGTFSPGFSPAYAIAFCAGVYLSASLAWWVPLGALLVSDLAINVFHYGISPIGGFMLPVYLSYVVLIGLGQRIKRGAGWGTLLSGGVAGALVFYVLTNTWSWLVDPDYPKSFAGWIQALTIGKPGFPQSWMFFKNTLTSGGLFTALFVGAMKLAQRAESADEEDESEQRGEEEPAESR